MIKYSYIIIAILFSCFVYSNAQDTTFTIHWNKARGYSPFKNFSPDGILLDNQSDTLQYEYFKLPEPSSELKLDFRAYNKHASPSKKYPFFTIEGNKRTVKNPFWGFFLTNQKDTLIFTLSGKELNFGIESNPTAEVKFYSHESGKENIFNVTSGINPYDGENIWSINYSNESLSLYGGDKGLKDIFHLPLKSDSITGFGFIAGWGTDLVISDINLEAIIPKTSSTPYLSISEISNRLLESDDDMEGYWIIFDRDLEENLLKLGGNYKLACLKENERYNLFYIDGANTAAKQWSPGDLKAILIPTPFAGIFDIIWYDSQKKPLFKEIKAQTGEGDTLTIQFPYQSSKIRLRKLSL